MRVCVCASSGVRSKPLSDRSNQGALAKASRDDLADALRALSLRVGEDVIVRCVEQAQTNSAALLADHAPSPTAAMAAGGMAAGGSCRSGGVVDGREMKHGAAGAAAREMAATDDADAKHGPEQAAHRTDSAHVPSNAHAYEPVRDGGSIYD